MKTVIFADLDGTLLDKEYNIQKTKPTLKKLKGLNADIVFCSSKTQTEIEHYREQTGINDPFISENGAAIFIPKNTLKLSQPTRQTPTYDIIELGITYEAIRQKIQKIIKNTGYNIKGFGDLTPQQISQNTGLILELAGLAKQRQYTEPIIAEHIANEVLEAAKQEGIRTTKGDRYYHFTGQHDKGEAVTRLKLIYEENFKKIHTMGIGNGPNDLSMLAVVEIPFYIQKHENPEKTWKEVLSRVAPSQKKISVD